MFVLTEPEAKKLLLKYGINVPEFKLAKNKEEALKIGRELGYPLVMKIVSPDILHKSIANCVKLNLKSEQEIICGFEEIIKNAKKYKEDARIDGVLLYKMVPEGVELIIGSIKDEVFGHVLMFGLGGSEVEKKRDISTRILPVTVEDVLEMIAEIKGYEKLKKEIELDEIVDTIIKVSKMIEENPDIKELDINPLIISANTIYAVDARIIK
ncbi:MAG: acetate--CoA ligase family protein [Candidatus Hydrothermarchaeota archaeon]